MWGATRKLRRHYSDCQISIHAPRVGSDGHIVVLKVGVNISIHAPRVGSDLTGRKDDTNDLHFNPRSPCGERPVTVLDSAFCFKISIHAPRVGSDGLMQDVDSLTGISIHAPRVGSDPQFSDTPHKLEYFNPRSPCGERPGQPVIQAAKQQFQSTLPVWGATSRFTPFASGMLFQSTLPVWGATRNPSRLSIFAHISIHAPRVGSDC